MQVKSTIPEGPALIDRVPAWRHRRLAALALVVTFAAYWRSLANRFSFDDLPNIVGNRLISQWSFLWRSLANDTCWFHDPSHLPQSAYYRPLQDIWFGLQFHLFGLSPAPWHATLVLLHMAGVWLIFRIAERLTGNAYAGLLAALLFGLIPIHAEAVAWEPGVDMSLSGVLELAAFYLFMTRDAGRWRWIVALMLYAGALLTHESAVVFPALAALYVLLIESSNEPSAASRDATRRLGWALIRPLPFAVEVVLYMIARRLSLGFIVTGSWWVSDMTAGQVAMTLPRVFVSFLALLAIPWLAGPHRGDMVVTSLVSAGFIVSAAVIIALAAGLFVVARIKAQHPLYLFCAGWIAIALLPMMNLRLLYRGAFVQDRYLYLASAGWCFMLAYLAVGLAGRGETVRRLAWAGAAAVLAVYVAVLWRVEHFWYDNESFYASMVERYPEQSDGRYGLGVALRDRGDLAGAGREFKAALELDPQSAALYDLGVVDSQLGHIKQAAAEEEEGLKRLSSPAADAYVGLAQIYDLNGDQAKSEAALKQAESLPNGAHVAALARAQLKYNHGDLAGAETILRSLVAADPYDPRSWTVLGMTAIRENHNEQALEDFRQAMALAPRDPFARVMAGLALHKLGRDQEALEQCRGALAIAPDDPNAGALIAKIARATASKPPMSAP